MEKLVRVFLFLQTIITELVGKFLNKQLQPDNFQTFLLNRKHILFHLYRNGRPCCACSRNENLGHQQVVKKVQFDLLYVQGNNTCNVRSYNHSCIYSAAPSVKVSELDVTLAITILKNCFANSLNLHELQSLDNIRKMRNDIAHNARNSDISEKEFCRMWSILEEAALKLAKAFDQEYFNDIKSKMRQQRDRRILATSEDYKEYSKQLTNMKDDLTESLGIIHERLISEIQTLFEGRGSPAIKIDKSDITATHGDQVVIPCSVVSNLPVTHVNWRRTSNNVSETILNDDSGYQGSTPVTPSLTIDSVKLNDAGTYICLAENAAGATISDPVTLIVNGGAPEVQIPQSYYTNIYGKEVVISCNIVSDSTVTGIYWKKYYKNKVLRINNGDKGYQGITPTSPSLIIKFATSDDDGTYVCHATNSAGISTSNSATLRIKGGCLDIDISPTIAKITQGNNITIKCTVSGQPHATSIIWQFTPNDGNENMINIVDCDGKYTGGSLQNPSLTVTNFQSTDAGSYVCYATNAVGISSSNSPSQLSYISLPVVQIPQNNYIDTYGKKVVIPCSIVSDSTLTGIYWEKCHKNKIVRINNGDKGYEGITPTSPSLIINFATSDDNGTYVCHVINAAGKSTSNSATLELNGDVLEVNISPISATVIIGQNQTISCTATGMPLATSIIWEFTPNGGTHSLPIQVEDSSGKYTGGSVHNPSLTITNFQPDDAGSYRCFALNALGVSSCIIPSVFEYTGTNIEISKRIDQLRLSGEDCRKTALAYSLLVYIAMRGSLSLEEEHSIILREIAEAVFNVSGVIVSRLIDIVERKLLPTYLKRMENGTFKPRDFAVQKIIIHSLGNRCIECLLKNCRFDILFDHVRLRKDNNDHDFLDIDAYTLARAFFQRIQSDNGDAYLIGQYFRQLEEIDRETLDLFVDILRQGAGDITFHHMDTFLDGLTKEGTAFEVFCKFPKLYDAFYRTVDKHKNTIFHFIVAFYIANKKYKTYIKHFCKNRFDLLQLRNCDNYSAIDFASFLKRTEILE